MTGTRWESAGAQPLTPREHEVMALIAEGYSNQEIAGRMTLSINSVKTHVRSAYRKVGVTRRAHAIAWGLEQGLVSR